MLSVSSPLTTVYTLLANGTRVGEDDNWDDGALRPDSPPSAGGSLFLVRMKFPDGTERWVTSGGSWRCSHEGPKG